MENERVLEHLRALKARGLTQVAVSAQVVEKLKKSAKATPTSTPKASPTTAAKPPSYQTPVAQKVAEPSIDFSKFNNPLEMKSEPKKAATLASVKKVELPKGDKKTQWEWLRQKVLSDEMILANVRKGKKAVFGVGNLDSPIFFCGEAPGAEEEEQGEPFVGRAGQLLTKIIEAMGVKREEVYIANILNYRPQMPDGSDVGNRPPTVEEMAGCLPYLKAQVEVVGPKAIIALGATATTGLLGYDPDRKMGETRGKFYDFAGTPVMVTYHPSYLLRNNTNSAKRIVWEDFMAVMTKVGMPINEKQRKYFT